MEGKRHKLRLKKQIVKYIPVAVMIAIVVICLTINASKSFANVVKNNNKANENLLNIDNADMVNEGQGELGTLLSNNQYIKEFNKALEQRQKDNTVIYYASKFKLDIDKTLKLAHDLTDNFTSEEYLATNVIAPNKLRKTIGSFDSFEAGVVYFIRDLYRYPNRYGLAIEDIRLDETPTLNTKIQNGKIIMDNGMTFEQYYGHICDLLGVDKSFGLAVVYHESGLKTSDLFRYKNNIGGLKGYDGWMSFTTLEAGVIAQVISIKAIIDKYGFDMSQSGAIAEFSSVYVNGHLGDVSDNWTDKVTIFKNQIIEANPFTIS